jgi:UDP-glucose 4-epimerase
VRWGPLVKGDILDAPALDAALARYRPRAVIHFAALAYVGESMSQPLAYYRANVTGLINLVEAMLRHGAKTIVFSSSCATYGIPDALPIAESASQHPINPYGRSKLAGEQILSDARAAEGVRVAVLRYFNAAGADPNGDLAERHDPETHLIPLAIDAATGDGPPLSIFGTDYPTADGTCEREIASASGTSPRIAGSPFLEPSVFRRLAVTNRVIGCLRCVGLRAGGMRITVRRGRRRVGSLVTRWHHPAFVA